MKLLVADDHPIFRKGMVDILKEELPHATILEAKDGEEAMSILKTEEPNMAILDIDMPGKTGLDVLRVSYNRNLDTKIIMLTMHKDVHLLNEAMKHEAKGYLIKDNSVLEIMKCIEYVKSGMTYISPVLEEKVKEQEGKENEMMQKLNLLTSTEMKTLKLVSRNFSSKEIAEKLFVTPKSVENYRSRMCKKLNLEGRSNSLLVWAMENKDLIEKL